MCEHAPITDPAAPADDNAAAFEQLLQTIDRLSDDERCRSQHFERLICDFLTQDPLWSDQFTAVQSYAQWVELYRGDSRVAALAAALGHSHTDIDLVGTNAADGRFTAIRCKYYPPDASVSREGIDAFISATNDPELFTGRMLVTTSSHFTERARHGLRDKYPPVVMLLTRRELAQARLDWRQYLQGQVHLTPPRRLHGYQMQAVEAALAGLRKHERGQLIMACGAGKTFIALRLTEELTHSHGLVLFVVPTLSLLCRSLSEWKRHSTQPLTALAVCSQQDAGRRGTNDSADITSPDELPYPAAASAVALAASLTELRQRRRAGGGLYVIFTTYRSLGMISEAQHSYGLGDFELIICDEAHHTAGLYSGARDRDLRFTRVHDTDFVRSARRLYMTATPRVYGEKPGAEGQMAMLCSMDDERIFGPVFHTFCFDEARRQGCLVDCRVIVLALSREALGTDFGQVAARIHKHNRLNLSHAARIIGCYRALSRQDLEEHGLNDDHAPMRRAVAFAQCIRPGAGTSDVTSSLQFSRDFTATVGNFRLTELARCQDEAQHQSVEQRYTLTCRCEHIDGGMDALEKERHLSWLRGDPAAGECRILFNARCLSGGTDMLALDAVIFLGPRRSAGEVVHAIRQVLHPAAGKKRGYIILPLVIPEDLGVNAAVHADGGDLSTLVQVMGALRSLDAGRGSAGVGQPQSDDAGYLEVLAYTRQPRASGMAGGGEPGGSAEHVTAQADAAAQSGQAGRSHAAEEYLASLMLSKLSGQS